jgi:thioesterase domain-containing protein
VYDITSMESLETALHTLIPISSHMGIKVVSYDGETLILEAPLENNINHQQSAFGGSLFSVAALTGWSLVQLKLSELGIEANTVIAGGEVSYDLPVLSQIRCECTLSKDYPDFVKKLTVKGKASLTLEPKIVLGHQDAMSFSGKFVVKAL